MGVAGRVYSHYLYNLYSSSLLITLRATCLRIRHSDVCLSIVIDDSHDKRSCCVFHNGMPNANGSHLIIVIYMLKCMF